MMMNVRMSRLSESLVVDKMAHVNHTFSTVYRETSWGQF